MCASFVKIKLGRLLNKPSFGCQNLRLDPLKPNEKWTDLIRPRNKGIATSSKGHRYKEQGRY